MDVTVPETGYQGKALAINSPYVLGDFDLIFITNSYDFAILYQNDPGKDWFIRWGCVDFSPDKSQVSVSILGADLCLCG